MHLEGERGRERSCSDIKYQKEKYSYGHQKKDEVQEYVPQKTKRERTYLVGCHSEKTEWAHVQENLKQGKIQKKLKRAYQYTKVRLLYVNLAL